MDNSERVKRGIVSPPGTDQQTIAARGRLTKANMPRGGKGSGDTQQILYGRHRRVTVKRNRVEQADDKSFHSSGFKKLNAIMRSKKISLLKRAKQDRNHG